MATDFHCMQCDKPEQQCRCDRYCCLCYSQHGIRLCEDGNYYCQPCRESCDLQAQYSSKA